MIVQPDFLDHWKTNALAARIGRLEAITALLALWAHCQQRRSWTFDFTPLMLAGICRYPSGNPGVLMETLLELNLLEKAPEGGYIVHDWAETNAALVHNWKAGKTGGRPRKQPQGEPLKNPRVNPSQTQGEPEGEPIREEKRREEITPVVPKGTDAIDGTAGQADTSTPSPRETGSAKKKKGGAAAMAIYEAYPRKVGRDAALRAIQKRLDEGITAEVLTDATRTFAACVARWPQEERQFVPHPATWFNQGRFADDPREWTRTPGPVNGSRGPQDAPINVSAPSSGAASGPPTGYEAAMAAHYGENWQAEGLSWFNLPASDRVKLAQWVQTQVPAAKTEGGAA